MTQTACQFLVDKRMHGGGRNFPSQLAWFTAGRCGRRKDHEVYYGLRFAGLMIKTGLIGQRG